MYVKMSRYWVKGDITIARVRKDVYLLRENRDMAIVNVRKDVTLLGERGHSYSEGT